MPEEAQAVTVTNTGQPLVAVIVPVQSFEEAQGAYATFPTAVTVVIAPVAD